MTTISIIAIIATIIFAAAALVFIVLWRKQVKAANADDGADESVLADDGKTTDGKTDDGKSDDGKTTDGKTDDGKSDDGKSDDGKSDDGKSDDGKTAGEALKIAEAAGETAGEAKETATEAKETATEAKETATEAKETATEAKETAEKALSKLSDEDYRRKLEANKDRIDEVTEFIKTSAVTLAENDLDVTRKQIEIERKEAEIGELQKTLRGSKKTRSIEEGKLDNARKALASLKDSKTMGADIPDYDAKAKALEDEVVKAENAFGAACKAVIKAEADLEEANNCLNGLKEELNKLNQAIVVLKKEIDSAEKELESLTSRD